MGHEAFWSKIWKVKKEKEIIFQKDLMPFSFILITNFSR